MNEFLFKKYKMISKLFSGFVFDLVINDVFVEDI